MTGQRLTREGVVVCLTPECGHQALFHDDGGCTFCDCSRHGASFDYGATMTNGNKQAWWAKPEFIRVIAVAIFGLLAKFSKKQEIK